MVSRRAVGQGYFSSMDSHSDIKAPILSFDFSTFMEHASMMSREHILTRLSSKHFVIHSTPPEGRHIKKKWNGAVHINNNLYHYTNPWYLPRIYRFKIIDLLFTLLRTKHRKRFLRNFGQQSKPILYLWHPSFWKEIGQYDEQLIIYHIYDDYHNLPNSNSDLIEAEICILQKADLVLVANESLLNERKAVVEREYLHFPQGVDFSIFEKARSDLMVIPDDMATIAEPRIGYIGRINEKVDVQLLIKMAESRPDWNFVMVGPVDESPKISSEIYALRRFHNVHFLGRKSFQDIAKYWLNIDVAIVPYQTRSGQWAEYGSPLKLREALAAAKPVVTSQLSDAESFGRLVRTAQTFDEWLIQIGIALDSKADEDLINASLQYAKYNSWDARVDMLENLLSSL